MPLRDSGTHDWSCHVLVPTHRDTQKEAVPNWKRQTENNPVLTGCSWFDFQQLLGNLQFSGPARCHPECSTSLQLAAELPISKFLKFFTNNYLLPSLPMQ